MIIYDGKINLDFFLSVFFGFGIVLLTFIQQSGAASQSGLDSFLFGKAAGWGGGRPATLKDIPLDSLKELEKDCYIYEITDLNSVFFDGDNFKNNKKVKINKNTYVDCIYDVLQKLGIKFNKYKDK